MIQIEKERRNIMKNKLKQGIVVVLTLIMVCSLTGCNNKEVQAYVDEMQDLIRQIKQGDDNLDSAVDVYIDAFAVDPTTADITPLMETIDHLEQQHQQLLTVEMPKSKKLENIRPMLEEATQKAIEGLTIYRTEFQGFNTDTIASEEAFDPFLERVSEGDALYNQKKTMLLDISSELRKVVK